MCVFLFLKCLLFEHLLESSHRDDSSKCSNIGFGQEITQVESIEVNFTQLIWCSGRKNLRLCKQIGQTKLAAKYLSHWPGSNLFVTQEYHFHSKQADFQTLEQQTILSLKIYFKKSPSNGKEALS